MQRPSAGGSRDAVRRRRMPHGAALGRGRTPQVNDTRPLTDAACRRSSVKKTSCKECLQGAGKCRQKQISRDTFKDEHLYAAQPSPSASAKHVRDCFLFVERGSSPWEKCALITAQRFQQCPYTLNLCTFFCIYYFCLSKQSDIRARRLAKHYTELITLVNVTLRLLIVLPPLRRLPAFSYIGLT